MRHRFAQPGRLLEAARKGQTDRSRFVAPNGDTILCESRDERKWWEDFCYSLQEGKLKADEFSIRDIFESVIPEGRSICDAWRNGENVSLIEAAGAVASSNFSNISGQIVYSKVMDAYQSEEFVFSKMIPTESTPFNGEKIPGITNLGDQAEIVDEGQPYPLAGVGEDWIETPETKKRGLIVPITKETIFFDRTGRILERCSQVGQSLGINREKRAIDCLIDENSTAHRYRWKGTSYATYQTTAPWVNSKSSNALVDWTDIDGVEQLFANMIDPYTGEPIVLGAATLIVTPQLMHAARYVMNATNVALQAGGFAQNGNLYRTDAPNPIGSGSPFSGAYQIATSRMLATRMATDTSWFLGDVSGAFRYMENFPLTTQTAPANSEAEFNRDIVAQYKASERGAYATIEPRKMCKSVA